MLRLTAARRGAILASLAVLLALMLGSQQSVAQQYTPTPTPSEAYMEHVYVTVGAQDLKRYEFYVCGGCRFAIIFYVYDPSWKPVDIIFRALDPEGKEIYPRGKVISLQWSFTAEKAGTYVLEFDNTYSILTSKYVDLALAVRPPPTTTTMYRTITEYRTLTATEYRTEYRVATEYRTLTIPITEYRTLTETLTVTPSILSSEGILILTLVAAVALILGILLTLLARRS
ncbi:MAG: emp24/gp25L/p24 family protein [Thaumarchaeota archaeon]|nr:emp24/gp25L/p24 family protein [Nitrososphaerota archaeon]